MRIRLDKGADQLVIDLAGAMGKLGAPFDAGEILTLGARKEAGRASVETDSDGYIRRITVNGLGRIIEDLMAGDEDAPGRKVKWERNPKMPRGDG